MILERCRLRSVGSHTGSRLIIEEDEDVYGFYYQRTDGCFDSKQSSIRNVSALHDFGKVPYSDGIGHPAPALTLTA